MTLTIKGGQEPGRNDPCPCGSKLKFKHCHGDPSKKAACEVAVRETMARLIANEQFKRKIINEEQFKQLIDCN